MLMKCDWLICGYVEKMLFFSQFSPLVLSDWLNVKLKSIVILKVDIGRFVATGSAHIRYHFVLARQETLISAYWQSVKHETHIRVKETTWVVCKPSHHEVPSWLALQFRPPFQTHKSKTALSPFTWERERKGRAQIYLPLLPKMDSMVSQN